MVIVQLKGGLGNQLFQYAAGIALAEQHQVKLAVDISHLSHNQSGDTMRPYELKNLVHPPLVAKPGQIAPFQKFLRNSIEKFLPNYKRIVYKEPAFTYDENFENADDNVYLSGYWQSEKYFSKYEKLIKANFVFGEQLTQKVQPFAVTLRSSESIAIHIRRGDLVSRELQDYHGILSAAYYNNAIRIIRETIQTPSFYIFSDDMHWVKQQLQLPPATTFVSGQVSHSSYEDFFLMQHCRHNIIANSSFSWWAAWLNSYPNKTVIAPKKWFNNAPHNTRDLLPAAWIRM